MTEFTPDNMIKLEIAPIPPATLSSTEQELLPLIEGAIREQGQGNLLDRGDLKIQIEQLMLGESMVIYVVVKYLCKAGLKVVEEVVIPILQKKYGVRRR